jgi:hypothetical protein
LRTKPITETEFIQRVAPIIGKEITRAWRGLGSAIFLEIGELGEVRYGTKRGERVSVKGQYTICLEWSWRVERPRSIEFGSWSTDRIITNRLRSLLGHSIADIRLFGRLPELQVEITGRRWITSYMTSEGQPEWGILSPDGAIVVRNGKLAVEVPERI